jgi:putative membrane protein
MMGYGRGFSFPGGCFGFGSGLWFHYVIGGVLLIVGILIVIMILKKKNNTSHISSEAIEMLKMKYVKGEITEEEYLKRKSVIND